MKEDRLIIYQVLPRLFTNMNNNCVANGTLEENGAGKLNDYSLKLLKSIKDLGVNCIWFTGVIEHATKTAFPNITADNVSVVKGEAGSPYAIKDYYDIAPSLSTDIDNRMKEFENLVERIHKTGMKLLIDFVPNHTAREYFSDSKPEGLSDFGEKDDNKISFSATNNYYYFPGEKFSPSFDIKDYNETPAKATGNDCFSSTCGENDWYETVKLNYGHNYYDHTDHFEPIPDTWHKMLQILNFWAEKGVDGFRCDMVFMVPVAFWHWVIPQVKEKFPHIVFIGEIYDINLYKLFLDYGCFDFLYDKVNLYDTIAGIDKGYLSAFELTKCWQRIDGIGNRMLNFLENHDEVRYASKSFRGEAGEVVPSLVVSSTISKGPFMIYFGQELGEKGEENEGFAGYNDRTTIFDYWSYDKMRRWYDFGKCKNDLLSKQEILLRGIYRKVLRLCNKEKALRVGDFFDLTYANLTNPDFDTNKLFAYFRYEKRCAILVVVNFDDVDKKVGVNIPELALEMIVLKKRRYEGKELLTDTKKELEIDENGRINLEIKGRNAQLLRINLDK